MSEANGRVEWTFIYSVYASVLAVVPLILHFVDIAWPYKIAIFYAAFLAISYGSLLSSRGRRVIMGIRSRFSLLSSVILRSQQRPKDLLRVSLRFLKQSSIGLLG